MSSINKKTIEKYENAGFNYLVFHFTCKKCQTDFYQKWDLDFVKDKEARYYGFHAQHNCPACKQANATQVLVDPHWVDRETFKPKDEQSLILKMLLKKQGDILGCLEKTITILYSGDREKNTPLIMTLETHQIAQLDIYKEYQNIQKGRKSNS